MWQLHLRCTPHGGVYLGRPVQAERLHNTLISQSRPQCRKVLTMLISIGTTITTCRQARGRRRLRCIQRGLGRRRSRKNKDVAPRFYVIVSSATISPAADTVALRVITTSGSTRTEEENEQQHDMRTSQDSTTTTTADEYSRYCLMQPNGMISIRRLPQDGHLIMSRAS